MGVLRLHLARFKPELTPTFARIPSTSSLAAFWQPGEVLAYVGTRNLTEPGLRAPRLPGSSDFIEYRFDETRVLYARLIPTVVRDEPFSFSRLMAIAELRRLQPMGSPMSGGTPHCNKYGAIVYESSGINTTPVALTQLHTNGEIWAVGKKHCMRQAGERIIAMVNVRNLLRDSVESSIAVAGGELGIAAPYVVQIGMVGLRDTVLSRPELDRRVRNQLSDRVHDDDCHHEVVLNAPTPQAQAFQRIE